jgi:hypothetical protein
MNPQAIASLLAAAHEAKDAILEATDLLHELDEQLTGAIVAEGKRLPKGNTSPQGLVRAAIEEERLVDRLALRALDRSMRMLALLEQALRPESPSLLLACLSCGSTVRLTERLAKDVKEPQCVACAGELVPAGRRS